MKAWTFYRNRKTKMTGIAAAGLLAGAVGTASAAITFTGTSTFGGTGLAASATFDKVGSDLVITLASTFTGDTPDQAHILTALYFAGAYGLTPVSAAAPAGSKEWNTGMQVVPVDGPSVLGQQWEYLAGLSGQLPDGATEGISSTGLGIFGKGNFASGGVMVDGSAYGILSAGYSGSTGDGLKTHGPYIQNSMTFTLSGFTGSLSGITDVVFQYGTSDAGAGEPSFVGHFVPVPEPDYASASAAAGLLLLVGAGWKTRRGLNAGG